MFVMALVYAVYCHVTSDIIPEDDAYITFRYVRNLYEGRGLVYNTGERVFGSTTPLYLAWLAAVKSFFPHLDVPTLAVRGNAVHFIAAILAFTALVRLQTTNWQWALVTGSLLAINPELLLISLSGMEPFLFVSLALWALYLMHAGRIRLSALLAGLATVTRPEGVILMAIWLGRWGYLRRPQGVRILGFALAAPVAWTLFATLYFGSPIPQSVVAKAVPIYSLPTGTAAALILYMMTYWTGILEFVPLDACSVGYGLMLGALAVLGVVRTPSIRRRGGAEILLCYGVTVLLYSVANPFLFPWYYPPLWMLWATILSTGLPAVLNGLSPRNLVRQCQLHSFGIGLASLALVALPAQSYVARLNMIHWPRVPMVRPAVNLRIGAYAEAARYLNGIASPGSTVAAPEIGALGYYFEGRILDACGLVSPEVLPFLPVPDHERFDGTVGAIGSSVVRQYAPDYVVTIPVFSRLSIESDRWFQDTYRLLHVVPLVRPVWDCSEVMIYGRDPNEAGGLSAPNAHESEASIVWIGPGGR